MRFFAPRTIFGFQIREKLTKKVSRIKIDMNGQIFNHLSLEKSFTLGTYTSHGMLQV